MVTLITQGINVSVETRYQPSLSDTFAERYLFVYRIIIANLSRHTVKLLRRHWHIFDSNGVLREVEGEGVVGMQPVIEPGQAHEYESYCNLCTDVGKMAGYYLMQREGSAYRFKVKIPEFRMVVPYRLN